MEELLDLKRRLEQERPEDWNKMPDIPLYMDQVISYMPRQLIHFDDRDALTSAMVNNYIKDGMVPRADGKRYNPDHLAHLTAVCALKKVLPVRTIAALMQAGKDLGKDDRQMYGYFQGALDAAMKDTAAVIDPEADQKELTKLALALALRSYANQLACERILNILEPEASPGKKGKK